MVQAVTAIDQSQRERAEIQQVEGDLIGVRGPENPSGRHLSESI